MTPLTRRKPRAPRPTAPTRSGPRATAAAPVAALAPAAASPVRLGELTKSTFRAHIVERLRLAILAGELPPGTPLVETALAAQFNVSRAPLREALRQLIEEGLVVTVPYTGTRVMGLSVDDLHEIQSMRVTLERFAFEQAWPRRDDNFRRELKARHAALTRAIDAGNDAACIDAELALHGLVYESSGHRLLQRTWAGLRGRLQLYWAAHHQAHQARGPRRDSHDSYVAAALGKSLAAMQAEISQHMQRGADQTEQFLRTRLPDGTASHTRLPDRPATPTRAPDTPAPRPRSRTTGASR
jgi:DNA-binding GntR family transcriptional regulator